MSTQTMTKEEMMADRLAMIKERYQVLHPSTGDNAVDEDIRKAMEKERKLKQRHNRLPFLTGLGCPHHQRVREVPSVIPPIEWLKEQAARHGFDYEHLVALGKTMDELLELFEKVPENKYKNFGGTSDGYAPDLYSNHYGLTSKREARQTSGTFDMGDNVAC